MICRALDSIPLNFHSETTLPVADCHIFVRHVAILLSFCRHTCLSRVALTSSLQLGLIIKKDSNIIRLSNINKLRSAFTLAVFENPFQVVPGNSVESVPICTHLSCKIGSGRTAKCLNSKTSCSKRSTLHLAPPRTISSWRLQSWSFGICLRKVFRHVGPV